MRIKRTKILSTKVTEKDNRYMRIMVNRYYEEGRIKQAKISTLLRLIVKRFLRRDCPEYNIGLLVVTSKQLITQKD
jgi:hypothetical protein